MEKNAAAGRTFGSIPVATPPPVSSSAITQSKPANSFQLRSRGQGMGMETSSSHGLHGFGDETASVYMGLDAKLTDSSEMLPLKSSAGHNVMVVSQGKVTLCMTFSSVYVTIRVILFWHSVPKLAFALW